MLGPRGKKLGLNRNNGKDRQISTLPRPVVVGRGWPEKRPYCKQKMNVLSYNTSSLTKSIACVMKLFSAVLHS